MTCDKSPFETHCEEVGAVTAAAAANGYRNNRAMRAS